MKTLLGLCSLLLIGLSACSLTPDPDLEPAPHGPAAWIDAPLNGSTIPLAEVQIIVHASDPAGVSSFELSVDGQLLGNPPAEAAQTDSLAHASQIWVPAAPGTYLLEVRASSSDGDFGPPAFAQVTVGGTPTPAVTPTSTPTAFVVTPTPPPTATAEGAWAIALENANCRLAPDRTAEVDDFLLEGQRALIEGISQDRTFVWIQTPSAGLGHCWVLLSVIRVEGSLEGLRTILPPPTPTPTATSGHV
jgi:hypothetical protein